MLGDFVFLLDYCQFGAKKLCCMIGYYVCAIFTFYRQYKSLVEIVASCLSARICKIYTDLISK